MLQEKKILAAMIFNDEVLAKIASKWNKNLFKSQPANLIGGWCVKYYNKYNKPPKYKIKDIYENWSESTKDEEQIRFVEKFLIALSDSISDAKEGVNSDYILDKAGIYFNQVKIENLCDSVQVDIDNFDIEAAKNKIYNFNQIELGGGEGINVLQDKDAIKKAFETEKEPLIQLPGNLGSFFGNSLDRDSFVAFLGPEKRGKTWWLIEIAFQAMLQRKKVAFFAAGDMTQDQMMRRLMVRASGIPLYPQKIRIPIKISKSSIESKAEVEFRFKNYPKGLNWRIAKEKCDAIMSRLLGTKKPYLKLSCHPNSTLNVKTIKSILKSWEAEDWIPDVIVIDYADIMDMSVFGVEGRDRINETWKQLRRLSQEYHNLVITATQSNAAGAITPLLNESNFSDDKRKAAHITGMIGLNQTDMEKQDQIMRLNWIYLRETSFTRSNCVYVANCLELGRVALRSCYNE
jgi:hypothetical protein